MAVLNYLSKKAAGKFAKKFAKKLTAKQLAASRRNIKKAIAARARKSAGSVVKVAKNPVKSYSGSVAKRTTKRRLKEMARTTTRLNKLKLESPRLTKRLATATRQSRISTGTQASMKSEYDVINNLYNTAQSNLDKKGSKGVLGYLRKQQAKKTLKELNKIKPALKASSLQANADRRSAAVADKLIALNEQQTTSLLKNYSKLSKGNSVKNYAGTVARDVSVVTAGGVGATVIYTKATKKKNKKS